MPTHSVIDGSTVTQVVDLGTRDVAYPVVADPAVQSDCGIVTCTVRFNRNTTNNLMFGAGLSGTTSPFITAAAAASTAAVAAVLWPVAGVIALKFGVSAFYASWVYNRGNCMGYRLFMTNWGNPMSWTEIGVKRGSYNCS